MSNDKLLSIAEASTLLGITSKTLRGYSTEVVSPVKTDGGHRRYLESDIKRLQGIDTKNENQEEITAVYVRVSSQDQKVKGDLERQKGRVLEYTTKKNYKVEHIFEEVGSGMNDGRAKLRKLFDLVDNHRIKRVVVEHKDRISRFNFLVYQSYLNSHGVEIEIIEQTLPKTFEDELVEDMLSLMSSFSAKIYGKRSHQNRKKQEEVSFK